ncbi:MAG: adenylate/guanylate cyclase domain-containing protein [Paracoccaceae bacterium]|nr:adenylate/guanylate cyclase domain-containing protein [Paracoccaceae bacterium]
MTRRLAAILAADVAGYSRLMEEDEQSTLEALAACRQTVEGMIGEHRGRIFGGAGDSFIAEFGSPVEATRCAVAIQQVLAITDGPLPGGERMQLRIGVNLGDVASDGANLLGTGVNIAARLEEIAAPGGICVSGTVQDHLAGTLDLTLEDAGEKRLKNIARPVRVWRWSPDSPAVQSGPPGTGARSATGRQAGAVSAKPCIAVLPFDNMSGDPDQEYFSDGLTEDIITALSKHRWLDVVARNSTFAYKGTSPDIRKLSKDLGADYVLEGSVRRAGQRIRVTSQLIDADTGNHLWAERYDRNLEDIFEVQDAITETIVGRIEPEIGTAIRQKVQRAPRRDLQAWDCYHLGIANFYKFTTEGNLEAQRLLQQSRELDPNFAEAHAWWAYAVILGMVYWDTEPEPDLMDEALAATRAAVALDTQNALLYVLMGRVQLARCEYRSALAENETAVRLNPTLAPAYCGLGDSLSYEGRYDEAIAQFEKAIEMSPNHPQLWAFLSYGALTLLFDRQFEKALDWAERALEIPNCQYWATAHAAVALAYLDQADQAARMAQRLRAERPEFSCAFARKKLFYLKRPEQLQLYLEGLEKAGVPAA